MSPAVPEVLDLTSQRRTEMTAKTPSGWLLTLEQAAARLSISPRMLQKLHAAGDGPDRTQIGRSVRYTPESLTAWVYAHQRSA